MPSQGLVSLRTSRARTWAYVATTQAPPRPPPPRVEVEVPRTFRVLGFRV